MRGPGLLWPAILLSAHLADAAQGVCPWVALVTELASRVYPRVRVTHSCLSCHGTGGRCLLHAAQNPGLTEQWLVAIASSHCST